MAETWGDIRREIQKKQQTLQGELSLVSDRVRGERLKRLSDREGRNVIAYYSGWLSKPDLRGLTSITDEDKNGFMMTIHGLDTSKGLDLILHTPGGMLAATESIVYYLRKKFDKNIRAIVPQIAMSAGTMIACSCKEILMAKHSNSSSE